MPAIAHLHRDAGVARLAQRHEIVGTAATTFGERKDVVDFLGRRQLALLLALLTKGMQLDVTIADTLPASAVAFVGLRVSLVLVVLFVHDLLMLGAVLLTLSEPTAAGVGAGRFGLYGIGSPHFRGIRKAPQDFSREASP